MLQYHVKLSTNKKEQQKTNKQKTKTCALVRPRSPSSLGSDTKPSLETLFFERKTEAVLTWSCYNKIP